jgi:hypothetical protein
VSLPAAAAALLPHVLPPLQLAQGAAVPADRPLHELGLDSLSVGQLSGVLEQVNEPSFVALANILVHYLFWCYPEHKVAESAPC